MNRRIVLRIAALGTMAAPLLLRAEVVRRIGILYPGAPFTPLELEDTLPLRKLGWVEGRNLRVEQRYANGDAMLLRPLAEELVRLKVELIVTSGTAATRAAMQATKSIPIIFTSAAAPVRAGLVASFSKPGGNVTGFCIVTLELETKRLQVLREILPSMRRVGYLHDSGNPYVSYVRADLEDICRRLGVVAIFSEATAGQMANAIASIARQGGQAVLIPPDDLFWDNRAELLAAVMKHALPASVGSGLIRESGALISYDYEPSEQAMRNAAYVDRVLRGAKPADLPMEQPTQFWLIINQNTARALGIVVPSSLSARADEIIR